MVIPNVYAMHRNEAEFPDANNFKPERYLKDLVHPLTPAGITEGHYSFGFGRRCEQRNVLELNNNLLNTIITPQSLSGEALRSPNGVDCHR